MVLAKIQDSCYKLVKNITLTLWTDKKMSVKFSEKWVTCTDHVKERYVKIIFSGELRFEFQKQIYKKININFDLSYN